MTAKPMTRLLWNGSECVERAKELLRSGEPVEIELPADFHHAIFSRIHPDGPLGGMELLDLSNGIELLEKIARIRQLHELADLAAAARGVGALVAVRSPAPLIALFFPGQHLRSDSSVV